MKILINSQRRFLKKDFQEKKEINMFKRRKIILFEDYSSEIGSGNQADFDNDNGEQFWGNFGAGVLPYCYETKRFLLNYRSSNVNEPHSWGIWGGKIENYEDIEDAVIRECE